MGLHKTSVAFLITVIQTFFFPSFDLASHLEFVGLQGWQVQAALYWIRTLYGLVAWPFVIFRLPLMGGFLTRASATGYDRRGRTKLLQVDKHPLKAGKTQVTRYEKFR